MPDVLKQLPLHSWRGQEYPITRASYGFRHEDAEQKIALTSLTIVQPGGARNPTFRYDYAMLQGLHGVGDGVAFELLRKLGDDCWKKEPGPLVDPYWGEWTCKPVSFDTDLDARTRNGSYARAEFIWAPELDSDLPAEGGVLSVEQLANDAETLDQEVAMVMREYDEPAPQPSADPLRAIAGLGEQLNRQIDRLDAALLHVIYSLKSIETALLKFGRKVTRPETLALVRECRRIRVQCHRKLDKAGGSRKRKRITVTTPTHVLTISGQNGMTIKEFAQLNPTALANPLVQPGTTVIVYAS